MDITQITKRAGAHRKRKRVGRGPGSGSGKTSGRGHKGAGARAGYRRVVLAEGGMFPLFRRLPKYGFNNAQFRTIYQVVNLSDLEARFENGGHVTPASLEEAGLVRNRNQLVKVLGDGQLQKKLTVEAHRFSASAESQIEKAGGTAKWLNPKPKKKFVKRPKTETEPEAKKEKSEAKKEKAAPKKEKAKPDKADENEIKEES